MDIRNIEESDLSDLSELFLAVFNEPPWDQGWKKSWALERLSIIYKSYRFYGLVVEEDGKAIAAVFARIGSFMGELELEIMEMFVSASVQRKGVGGELLNALKEMATKDGIQCFVLQTGSDTFAKDFYLKYGFNAHVDNLLMSHEF